MSPCSCAWELCLLRPMNSSLGWPLLHAAPTTAAPKATTAAPKAPATTAAPSKGSIVVGRRRHLLQGTQEVVDVTVEVDMGSGNAAAVSGASNQLASVANSGLLRVRHGCGTDSCRWQRLRHSAS